MKISTIWIVLCIFFYAYIRAKDMKEHPEWYPIESFDMTDQYGDT